jgi:hypothetical protein
MRQRWRVPTPAEEHFTGPFAFSFPKNFRSFPCIRGIGNFDYVLDDALHIALDYVERTGQAATFREVQSTAAVAIVAAWKAGVGHRIKLADIAIKERNHFWNISAADNGISRLPRYGSSRHRARRLEVVRIRGRRDRNGQRANPTGGGNRSREGY